MTPIGDIAARVVPGDGKPVPLVIASILRPEGTTGVHTHIRELCAYLDEKGLPYELVTPFSWGRPLSTVIFSLRFPLQWAAPPAGVAWYRYWHTAFLTEALHRQLAHLGPAIVYAQGPEAARASLGARVSPRQRVVMAVHFLRSQADGWVTKGQIAANGRVTRSIQQSERRIVEKLDGIVYVSNAASDQFVSAVPGAAAIPSRVIPNFVRSVPPEPPGKPLADLVTVGGLEVEKNQQFILRVLALAKEAGKNYTLDIYGTGSLRASLERTATELGISGQVCFRGFDHNVRAALPSYRAYVHSCPAETGPLALIEAMAAGLPIVAGASGGVPELLSDGVEGRYWPLDDPAASAETLIALLEDEDSRRTAARAASLRFMSRFTTERLAPELLDFLGNSLHTTTTPHRVGSDTYPSQARATKSWK